jgi:hypothetical protein
MITLSTRERLHWSLQAALEEWRATHGIDRDYARDDLRSVLAELRRELRRSDVAFRAAVTQSREMVSP